MTHDRNETDYCEKCRRPLQPNLMAEISGLCDHCRSQRQIEANRAG